MHGDLLITISAYGLSNLGQWVKPLIITAATFIRLVNDSDRFSIAIYVIINKMVRKMVEFWA